MPAIFVLPDLEFVPGDCLYVGTRVVLGTDAVASSCNVCAELSPIISNHDVKTGECKGLSILENEELLEEVVEKISLVTPLHAEVFPQCRSDSIYIQHYGEKGGSRIGKDIPDGFRIHCNDDVGCVIKQSVGHRIKEGRSIDKNMEIRWRVLGGEWHLAETKAETVGELMTSLELSAEEYLPSVRGKLVTEDERLEKDAEITFIPVVSGG